MLWDVTVSLEKNEKTYCIEAERDYGARLEALKRFQEEFRIAGNPVEYLTKRRGYFNIVVRSAFDKRKQPRSSNSSDPSFYIEQVGRIMKLVRESSLQEEDKVKAGNLLSELEELFRVGV